MKTVYHHGSGRGGDEHYALSGCEERRVGRETVAQHVCSPSDIILAQQFNRSSTYTEDTRLTNGTTAYVNALTHHLWQIRSARADLDRFAHNV